MEAPWACESFGIVLVFIFEGLVMADHYPIPTLDFHCFHSLSIHLPTTVFTNWGPLKTGLLTLGWGWSESGFQCDITPR